MSEGHEASARAREERLPPIVLRQSVLLLRVHGLRLFGLALLCLAPFYAMEIAFVALDAPKGAVNSPSLHALKLAVSQISSAALVFAALRVTRGYAPFWGRSISAALSSFLHVLTVGLAASLSLLAIAIHPLFIIPGLWLLTTIYLALPIVVYEKKQAIEAVQLSAVFTRGYRWQLLSLILVLVVPLFVLQLIMSSWGSSDLSALVVGAFAQLLVNVFEATFVALAYTKLREVPPWQSPKDAS